MNPHTMLDIIRNVPDCIGIRAVKHCDKQDVLYNIILVWLNQNQVSNGTHLENHNYDLTYSSKIK